MKRLERNLSANPSAFNRLWAAGLACAALALSASAETWRWTGAADAFWTNAANWTVNGAVAQTPPGNLGASYATAAGPFDSVAEFGACETANVTIDLDGLYDVSNVLVKAGAPAYTFGTGAGQVLAIHATGGIFRVESGVANKITVAASFGNGRYPARLYKKGTTTDVAMGNASVARAENFGAAELEFQKMFYFENDVAGGETTFRFGGTGDIRLSGKCAYKRLLWLDLYMDGAKIVWDFSTYDWSAGNVVRKFRTGTVSNEIEVTEGNVLSGYNGMGPFEVGSSHTLVVSGAGEFNHTAVRKNSGKAIGSKEWQNNTQAVNDGGRLVFLCRNTSREYTAEELPGGKYYGSFYLYNYGGTVEFVGANEVRSPVQIVPYYSGYTPTLRARSIGTDDAASSLGYAPFHFGNNARLLYVGPGETCSRTLCITNRSAGLSNSTAVTVPAAGTVEQGGTGKLTFGSPVRCACSDASGVQIASAALTLANSTDQAAEATTAFADDGTTVLNLVKTGTGVWTLSGANTYTGTTTVEGGVLEVGGENGTIASSSALTIKNVATLRALKSLTLPAITTGTGGGTVAVADGATVEVTDATATAGLLNFTTTGSGKVKFTGAGAATAFPVNVKLNGAPAEFNAAGEVVRSTYVTTTEISAYGGRIPNDAAAVVGITSAGEPSAGPITLADALTTASVDALVQKTATAATVDLAAGQTLQAKTVAAVADAAALTIGSAVGQGTLASADDLMLDNASENELRVNAAVSVPTTKRVCTSGAGTVRLTAPFVWAGELVIGDGVCALAGAQTSFTSTLEGLGTFRKEGTDAWTLTKAQPNFSGDFEIAGGTVVADGDANALTRFGNDVGALVVTNGGQFKVTANTDLINKDKPLRLAGSGPDGTGVVRADAYVGYPRKVTLMDDVLLGGKNGHGFYSMTLDMNGHAVDQYDYDADMLFNNCTIVNPGPFRLAPRFDAANNWAYFTVYNCDLGDETAPPIVATNGTRISINNDKAPIRRAVRIVIDPNGVGPEMSFTGGGTRRADGVNTNGSNWAGPIEIVNANTHLSFNPWETHYANSYETVSGNISGAGDVCVGGSYSPWKGTKSNSKGHVVLGGANTYTGGTRLAADNGSSITLLKPASMPDWNKAAVSAGGRYAIAWGEGMWSKADYVAAANHASTHFDCYTSGVRYVPGVIAIDTSYGTDAERHAEIALTDADVTGEHFSIGHDGEGSLTVRGPFTKPIDFGCYAGTLRFAGADAITLGAGQATFDWTNTTGRIAFVDAGDVHFAAGGVRLGGYGNVSKGRAEMLISNSRVVKDLPASGSSWKSVFDSTMVGVQGCGTLTIEGDSTLVTNRHVLGYSNGGRGALVIKGGTVVEYAPTASKELNSIVGFSGDGYLELDGGFYDCRAANFVLGQGSAGGQGVFAQYGGRAEFGTSQRAVLFYAGGYDAESSDAVCTVYLAGGVTTNWVDTSFVNGPRAHAYFTVDGGEYVNRRPANPGRNGVDTLTIVNLNGGTFAAWNLAHARNDEDRGTAQSYVNFNGGTFRATTKEYPIFGRKNGATWNNAVDRVTVYAGGAVIDVPSSYCTSETPIVRPFGKGVKAVTGFVDDGGAYEGAPTVEIVNGEGSAGTGASAFAKFDSATRRVTEIKITSAGCGYTAAKAVIRYNRTAVTNDCELADNACDTGKGLVKKGAGTFRILTANTYAGPTTIEQGAVELGEGGSLPTGSQVVLKGGVLTAASGVTLPALDYAFTLGETVQMTQNLAFGEGSTITVKNLAQALAAHGTYVLLETTGAITGRPTLANKDELPPAFGLRVSDKRIRLVHLTGTTTFLR